MEDNIITSSPLQYDQWLRCFGIMQKRNISNDEYLLICGGKCRKDDISIEYIENELVRTMNIMLKRLISEFRRELDMYIAFGETENIHIPYARFAQKIKKCLFFYELDFMSIEFRNELMASLMESAMRFWKKAYSVLYEQCIERTNPLLEDELYIIRGLKLFYGGRNE